LRRRTEFDHPHPLFAPKAFSYPAAVTIESRRAADLGYRTELFAAGAVSLAPRAFTDGAARVLPGAPATGTARSVAGGAEPG
jgi:hypothetical protein